MRRREFVKGIVGSAIAAWSLAARAQQASSAKLGVLLVENREPFWKLFSEGLRDFGYIDGQNVQIEFRSAGGKLSLLPELASDLVRLKVSTLSSLPKHRRFIPRSAQQVNSQLCWLPPATRLEPDLLIVCPGQGETLRDYPPQLLNSLAKASN